jgi:hypothetical protein
MPGRGVLLALALATLPAATATAEITREEIGQGQIATMVRVEEVRRDGDTVQLRLVNLTSERLENLRVLVSESFRWKDETHPGEDDPSHARIFTVAEPIAPGATRDVTVTLTSPPVRGDGWFVLDATVVGLDTYPAL